MILGVAPWQQLLRQAARAAALPVAAMAVAFPVVVGMAAAVVAATQTKQNSRSELNPIHRGCKFVLR